MTKRGDQKTCFVICPIGTDGSATRKRSDKLFKYVIERVLKPKGYLVDRADKVGEPGIITNQIVRRIVDCDILIADLTEHNPNVFYELALRHGLKKPFIHLIDANEAIPFDNAQVRAIQVDLTDLDSVELACTGLLEQVESIETEGHIVESPISIAFDLENLKTSGKPDEAILATVLEEISSLRREMSSLRVRSIPPIYRLMNPRSEQEIYQFLSSIGKDDFLDYIKENLSVIIDGKNEITIMPKTSRGTRDIDDVQQQLKSLLRKHTLNDWEVSTVPF